MTMFKGIDTSKWYLNTVEYYLASKKVNYVHIYNIDGYKNHNVE